MKLVLFFILLLTSLSAPYRENNKNWNTNLSSNSDPSTYYGLWENHIYYPSPKDWRNESIYQLLTDRYADGNPVNNEGKYGGFDLNDISSRHGGDFVGIASKLDYIKSLGFTTIWISPVFQNYFNSYHGYAMIDFTLLDDRFGTLSDFRYLVTEAHKKDIKIIVDVVFNHMDNFIYFEGYEDKPAPFKFHIGEYKLFWKDENVQYEDFKINNTFIPLGKYADTYTEHGDRISDPGEGSFWNSDFHHNGNLQDFFDPWQDILGKLYGTMDDLRTESPRVRRKLIEMIKSLIASTDIDGFRVDTPMQIDLGFFQEMIPEVKAFAKKLGKENLFFFGEYLCSKEKASTMTGRGKSPYMYGKDQYISNVSLFDGGIHYPLHSWFNTSIKNQENHLSDFYHNYKADLFDYDWYNPVSGKYEYRHINFFDNHDQWRMSSSEDGFKKTLLSSGLIAFLPGIPSFYYGDEQEFRTDGNAFNGYAREDFFTSLAWKSLNTPLGPNVSSKDNFDMTSNAYLRIQQFMNIRNSYSVLRTCDNIEERWTQSNNTNGIFAFVRSCGNERALIIFNTWKMSLSANGLRTYWSDRQIVNLLNTNEVITLDATNSGVIEFIELNGYEIKIFIPLSDYKPLPLTVKEVHPKHDEAIIINQGDSLQHEVNIKISFSDKIEKETLVGNVLFNDNKIPVERIILLSDSTISFTLIPKEGINYIQISKSLSSVNNQTMNASFSSRFSYGYNDNIIINNDNQKRKNLVNIINEETLEINHKANGAELYRVLFKYSNGPFRFKEDWSEWKKYSNSTNERYDFFVSGKTRKTLEQVVVQYYVDKSSAYYVYQDME